MNRVEKERREKIRESWTDERRERLAALMRKQSTKQQDKEAERK